MGNCLKTQLKEVVNNENLPFYGMVKIVAKATQENAGFLISGRLRKPITIKSSEPFTAYTYISGTRGEALATGVTSYTFTYNGSNGQCFISVANDNNKHVFYVSKWDLSYICTKDTYSVNLGATVQIKADDLKFSGYLSNLVCSLSGSIAGWTTTVIDRFFISDSNDLSGDITNLINANQILRLSIPTGISYDLDELSGECGQLLLEAYLQNAIGGTGSLSDWCQRIHDAGRTSGSFIFNATNSSVTINGSPIIAKSYTVTFTEEGYTIM